VQAASVVDLNIQLEIVGCTKFTMNIDHSILIVERTTYMATMCLFNVVFIDLDLQL
jgi:hypothetical protein